jgi:hypothetical protein
VRLDSVKMMAFLAAPSRSSSAKARSSAVSSALPLALSRMLVASVLKWRSSSISCAMASRSVRARCCDVCVLGRSTHRRFRRATRSLRPVLRRDREPRALRRARPGGAWPSSPAHPQSRACWRPAASTARVKSVAAGPRQRLEVGAAQVIGDEPGKFLLFARWRELLDDGLARRVRHVGLNLFAQGALADGASRSRRPLKDCSRPVNCERKLSRSPNTRSSMMLTSP